MKYDFEESVGFWLTLAHQGYSRAIAERLLPHGITFRQAQVLGYLELDGPQTQSELAARMLIEPPSLVGVLNRMERSLLVQRQGCAEDRRRNVIHLLPAAEALWQQIADCAREVRTEALRGMSAAEVKQLKRLLNKVSENVNAS
jgi:MarR family transcriptional regulator for hemolysin